MFLSGWRAKRHKNIGKTHENRVVSGQKVKKNQCFQGENGMCGMKNIGFFGCFDGVSRAFLPENAVFLMFWAAKNG